MDALAMSRRDLVPSPPPDIAHHILLLRRRPMLAFEFEPQPHASPKSGPSLGLTHGTLEPLVCLLDLPVFLIQPSNFNLNGTNHE